MTDAPPRLRRDLTVSEQQTPDGLVLVVKEPISGKFFRFRAIERYIANQFDGTTSYDEIRKRVEQEFEGSLDTSALRTFAAQLERSGLLESSASARAAERGRDERQRRIRGSMLYLRCPLFDPDWLFTRIEQHIRFCFTGPFLLFSGCAILFALLITAANGPAIAHDISGLAALAALPFIITLAVIVVSAHEFAHGITCKHYGGAVHEWGFMLVYFQPFFYCNVSDAWLFPEKSKRLWVGFAGLYFELFLWALATLVWRVTDVGTPVNYLAVTVMAISGIKSVFDLNPFIKLDGYYILSDALEMPNLRRRAFKYVGDGIKRVLGFGHHVVTEVSRRDRRVLVIYGLIATVSSFALLAIGLEKAGSLLIENDQPLALVFLTGYAGMRLVRRLKRLFGHTAATATVKKPRVPIGKLLRRLFWAAAAAGAIVYVFKGYTELSVAGPFTVLPEHNADVRAEVEGIIESVRVDEGTFVQTGALIAHMSDKDLRAELAKTNADIEQARALLRKQEAGPTQAEIDIAKAAAARAADASAYAQAKLDRISPLFKAGRVSGQEFDDAQEQARLTATDRAAADGQLRLVTAGTRPEDVDATKAQIDGLATHASLVAAQLKELDILSPATGVVATPSRELHALRGQHVNKGDLIAKVYTVKTVTAQMSVGEKELADVHVGLPVLLRARAYPDVVFHGTVTAIATAAEGMSSNTSPVSGSTPPGTTPAAGAGNAFVVTTEIDNSAGVLKPGMTGLAKISDGRRRIVDVLRQRIERTLKVEVWSWL